MMANIPLFKIEEFWKKYEFSAPHLLCPSDAEGWSQKEILDMADAETLTLWNNLTLGYTESPGLPLLRQEISSLYSTLDAKNILTTAGAEEGIYCALNTLLNPDDHVIIIKPCYQSFETLPIKLGAWVTSIELTPENSWRLELAALKAAWTPSTKLLIINSPHNPTGNLLDREVYEGMIKLATNSGAYLFFDEVYRFLEMNESKRLPSIAETYSKGISLNVMTKSFGLGGLRVGWLASKDLEFLQNANAYKMYTSICNSAPSEILSLIALRAKATILKRNREIVQHNLNVLDDFIERHTSSLKWVRPEGGTVAFIELLLPLPIEDFTVNLVKECGVLIMPASQFDYAGNFFRIGFGRKNMPEVLLRFEEYLIQCEHRLTTK